jgi:hypothetical protein
MKLIQKTFVCDPSIDDPSMVCDQLAVGTWVVEAGYTPVPAHHPDCLSLWQELASGAALSVSSGTALRLALGPALMNWLARTHHVADPIAGLALHELIVNAALHGNLGVTSDQINLWRDLATRQAAFAASLEDIGRQARMVTVAFGWSDDRLVAIISDEGSGYQTDSSHNSGRGSGRGLRIARAVGHLEVLSGGCQTVLTLTGVLPGRGC